MFFSYSASVLLLALALYGVWQVARDVYGWVSQARSPKEPAFSIILYVRNADAIIEDLLDSIFHELDDQNGIVDLLLVDGGSQDLTVPIMQRMTVKREEVRLVALTTAYLPVHEVLPLCRGGSIHLFDLANRLSPGECLRLIHRLLSAYHPGTLW